MYWLRRLLRPIPRLRSIEAYKIWAESYPPFAHNALMDIEQTAMLRLMPDLRGCRVLDLACGSGRYSLIAASHGAKHVMGIDNSDAMLLTALRTAERLNLVQAPMTTLPFPGNTFDVILCGLATGHLTPQAMQLAFIEIARVLCPGGKVLFSDFHPALHAHGGRRTFTASNGQTYEVEHYPHTVDDYVRAVETAGLLVDVVEEPIASNLSIPAVLAIRCKSNLIED